jgi:hypothetical protein
MATYRFYLDGGREGKKLHTAKGRNEEEALANLHKRLIEQDPEWWSPNFDDLMWGLENGCIACAEIPEFHRHLLARAADSKMSTNFRFTEPVSEAEVREAAKKAGLSIEQGENGTTVTDGTSHIHVFFTEERCTGFCRYGANSSDLVYELGDELGVGVLNEHDEGYLD